MSADVFSDAQARYDDACERRAQVIAAWDAEGRPLTSVGSQGQLVDHPLVKQINALDALCDRLGESLRRKGPGRKPVAVVSASVGSSPAADRRRTRGRKRLRAVS